MFEDQARRDREEAVEWRDWLRAKKLLALVALVFACGAPAGDGYADLMVYEHPMDHEPGGYPGLMGWNDGEKEEYCAENPDEYVCSDEIGTAEQAWVSAEYFGQDLVTKTACYADTAANACGVARFKQAKVNFDTSACLSNTIPILQAQVIMDALKAGALLWNNSGTGVTVSLTSGSQQAFFQCAYNIGNAFGLTVLAGPPSTQISNLPAGPHGHDEGSAIQYPQSATSINVQNIWNSYVACDSTQTNAELANFARRVGAHEMGHAFGFIDFASGLMKSGITCTAAQGSIDLSILGPALGVYSGTAGGASVVDQNLENYL